MGSSISLYREIKSLSGSTVTMDNQFNNHGIGDSPLSNIFRLNKLALITDTFDQKSYTNIVFDNLAWTYNPKLFCYDYYNDMSLDRVILMVNDLKSQFDFKPASLDSSLIIAPDIDLIYKLVSGGL